MMSKADQVEEDILLTPDHVEVVSYQAANVMNHCRQMYGAQVAGANALAWVYGIVRWASNELSPDTAVAFLDAARERVLSVIQVEADMQEQKN